MRGKKTLASLSLGFSQLGALAPIGIIINIKGRSAEMMFLEDYAGQVLLECTVDQNFNQCALCTCIDKDQYGRQVQMLPAGHHN